MKPFIILGLGITLSAGAMYWAYEYDTQKLREENKYLKQELKTWKAESTHWKQMHSWVIDAINKSSQPITISTPHPLPTNVSARIIFYTNAPAQ